MDFLLLVWDQSDANPYGAGTVIGLPLSTMCTVNSFSVLSPTTL
jgi:hypothetical protein